MKQILIFSIILSCIIVSISFAQSPVLSQNSAIPLENTLNPENMVDIQGGLKNIISAADVNMKTDAVSRWQNESNASAVAVVPEDSSWDVQFAVNGLNGVIFAMAVIGTDLYIGGNFTTAGGVTVNRIAKWNGSNWSSLGSGMNNNVTALASSGTDLYAGGTFLSAGGVAANYVAKWNGSSWSALGTGLGSSPSALIVIGNELYAGGNFTTAGGSAVNRIAKWDGTDWSALGSGMNAYVGAFAAIGNDLYAGGGFTTAGGVTVNRIARWDGANWYALGTGMSSDVYALTVKGTDLYASGGFTSAGGTPAGRIAKWNGASWSALGSGLNYGANGLAVLGTDIYAGGYLTMAGGSAVNRIAKWNGSGWTALGSGLNSVVNTLAVIGSDLYVGGYFTTAGGNTSYYIGRWIANYSIDCLVQDGWNLMSVPVHLSDFLKTSLFPSAISPAFTYQSSYQAQDTLRTGKGYWLQFNNTQTVSLRGQFVSSDTADVAARWNIIGSVSSPVATSTIISVPGGVEVSPFYGYNGSYFTADTIYPGRAYWVRVSETCKLILSSSSANNPVNRIHIVPTSELPPAAPGKDLSTASMEIPDSYVLEQNYPNPFNPTTSIRFALPKSSFVTLKVFNLLGQEVAVLVDWELPAGYQVVTWDASKASSGIYLYCLQAGPYVETKKLLLLR